MANIELKAETELQENEVLKILGGSANVDNDLIEQTIHYDMLTPKEQEAIDEYVKEMKHFSQMEVLQFGSGPQMRIAKFADSILDELETKEIKTIGELLEELVGKIKGFHQEVKEQSQMKRLQFFHKDKSKINRILHQYQKTQSDVEQIEKRLKEHRIQMLKEVQILEKLSQKNLANLKEISLYIIAGEKKLEELFKELSLLKEKTKETKELIDSAKVQNLESVIRRLEKRIYDLKMTRVVSLQMEPQMRLLKDNQAEIAEKVQSSLVTTIPLWKNEVMMALEIGSKQKEMMDFEVLQKSNQQVLKALEEVISLGEKGKQTEEDLSKFEKELEDTMPEIEVKSE